MQFKLSAKDYQDFDEEFTSPQNKQSHYDKHIKGRKEFDMTPDEYEKAAEELANTPCNYKRIHGYVSKDPNGREAYVKYDKDKELYTVYVYKNNKPYTITAYRKTWRDFYTNMYSNEKYPYVDEIPAGK